MALLNAHLYPFTLSVEQRRFEGCCLAFIPLCKHAMYAVNNVDFFLM